MTNTVKTTSTPNKTSTQGKDAIGLLKDDHLVVRNLFSDYKKTRSLKKKKALVAMICTELNVHMAIEEEIFYPAVKAALKDKILIPEATVEHSTVKELIGKLEGVEPDGELYEARVRVLSEYIQHHIKEEQGDMFPKAKAALIDMIALGNRMRARKADLLADLNGTQHTLN